MGIFGSAQCGFCQWGGDLKCSYESGQKSCRKIGQKTRNYVFNFNQRTYFQQFLKHIACSVWKDDSYTDTTVAWDAFASGIYQICMLFLSTHLKKQQSNNVRKSTFFASIPAHLRRPLCRNFSHYGHGSNLSSQNICNFPTWFIASRGDFQTYNKPPKLT